MRHFLCDNGHSSAGEQHRARCDIHVGGPIAISPSGNLATDMRKAYALHKPCGARIREVEAPDPEPWRPRRIVAVPVEEMMGPNTNPLAEDTYDLEMPPAEEDVEGR